MSNIFLIYQTGFLLRRDNVFEKVIGYQGSEKQVAQEIIGLCLVYIRELLNFHTAQWK